MSAVADVRALRPALARAAQAVLDEWRQDADGIDEEHGAGGVCHVIADRMVAVLCGALPDVDASAEYVEADCHVEVVARVDDGVIRVDVPARIYETGAGYVWRKIEGIALVADDVHVDVLSHDPDDHALYATLDDGPSP